MRIPTLVLERGLGTEAQSSFVLSAMMITSIFGGVWFGKLNQILKEKITGVCMIVYGLGVVMIAYSGNMIVLGIGAMIAGAAQNLMVTALFNNASNRVPANLVKIGTTFVLVGCNLGASSSALTLKFIGFFTATLSGSFLIYAAILLILGFGMLLGKQILKKK